MYRFLSIIIFILLLLNHWLWAQEESSLDIPAYVITAQDREVLSVPYGLELQVSSAETVINEPVALPPSESSRALEVAVEGVEFPPADLDIQRSSLFRLINQWRSTGSLKNQAQLQLKPWGWEPGLSVMVNYLSLQEALLDQSAVQKMELSLASGFSLPYFDLFFTESNYIEYSDISAYIFPRFQASAGLSLGSLTLTSQLFSAFQAIDSFYFYHKSRLNYNSGFLGLELEQSVMAGPTAFVSGSHMASASLIFGHSADFWLIKAGATLDYSENLLFYPRLELGLFFNPFLSLGLSVHYTKDYPELLTENSEQGLSSLSVDDLSRTFYTMKWHIQKSKLIEWFLRLSYVKGDSRNNLTNAQEPGQWLWLYTDGSFWPAQGLELKSRFEGDYDLLRQNIGFSFESALYLNWPDFLVFGPGGGYAALSGVYSPAWIFDYCDLSDPVYFFFDIKLPREKHIDFESRLGIYIHESELAVFGQFQLVLSL